MTITKKYPGTTTEGSTEAISSVDSHSTTSLVSGTVLPTVNQLIFEEVAIFLGTKKQSTYCPEDVEMFLLNRINERLLGENKKNGLRGALAHRPLKVLPPSVIATCILKRELRHTGLIGESEETAELVTYEDAGLDKGLYVPAEQRIRHLARQYHYTISPKDLNAVVECVRDTVADGGHPKKVCSYDYATMVAMKRKQAQFLIGVGEGCLPSSSIHRLLQKGTRR